VLVPYGLVSAGASWYLCADGGSGVRFWRLSRISRAEALYPVSDDTSVDVAAEWRRSRDAFRQSLDAVEVDVWVRDTRQGELSEQALTVRSRKLTSGSPGEDWAGYTLGFVDQLHAVTTLLRLGGDALVDGPAAVRHALCDHARGIIARYE
jgi:predicted DNA-binding transcriptional regulator YafY